MTKRIGSRTVAVFLVVSGMLAACSPLPNPNPSSPANQLPAVGSPNQLPIPTPATSR